MGDGGGEGVGEGERGAFLVRGGGGGGDGFGGGGRGVRRWGLGGEVVGRDYRMEMWGLYQLGLCGGVCLYGRIC